MEKSRTIKDIIFLPYRFYKDGNVSAYSLLKESGYFEIHNQIREADFFQVLIQHLDVLISGYNGQKINKVVKVGILVKLKWVNTV